MAIAVLLASNIAWAAGDPARGAAIFQACAACHSAKPGVHLTGPSLANVWGKKAGTVHGFPRYSEAMKRADVVWNDRTLDRWLKNPEELIPGTSMTFGGLSDPEARRDVIAYLRSLAEGRAPEMAQQRGGMMAAPDRIKLKDAPAQGQVMSITHCADTYSIKTGDGKLSKVWEFNLRFKTDSSQYGPARGKPVIIGAGMQGDRASVVFATPEEISAFVKESCP